MWPCLHYVIAFHLALSSVLYSNGMNVAHTIRCAFIEVDLTIFVTFPLLLKLWKKFISTSLTLMVELDNFCLIR